MAKKEAVEKATIISLNDYQEDLEKEVAYYFARTPPQVKNTIKYSRTSYPERIDPKSREDAAFVAEEFRRCIEGYNHMSGKLYFFYNYCFLKDPELGKIRPDYRKIAADWFQFITDHQAEKDKRGIVSIKRRRVGASFMAASDVLHDCIFNPFFSVGMTSRSETAARDLFKHVKLMYQNLPEWMRPRSTASDRRDFMDFSYYVKDGSGNRIKKGLQSSILSVAPTDSCFEGYQFGKGIFDEGGKVNNLLTMWSYSQDCFMKPPRMVGLPMIFGTVGSLEKGEGTGIKEIWEKNEVYGFDRFFFGGYNALDGMIDELGNDDYENGIRWILYERHKKKSAKKEYEAHKQKYPLDAADAFYLTSGGGVGNRITIQEQITKLVNNPPERRTGWMRPKPDGGVDFVPNPDGKIVVYELPDPRRINGYHAGADPIDHDDVKKTRDSSNLALMIVSKPFGLAAPKLVLEYADRPEKADSFFEQSAMALKWYNNTKVLIEDNRARMINYFLNNYPKLLPLVPKSIGTARGGSEMKYSVKMTEERKQQMMGLIETYVDNYCQFIPSIDLLEEFKVFGDDHRDDDRAIAFGWALVMLQADKKAVTTTDQIQYQTATKLEWQKGHLVRVASSNQNKPIIGGRRKHPILG